jgi:hypothetical protein
MQSDASDSGGTEVMIGRPSLLMERPVIRASLRAGPKHELSVEIVFGKEWNMQFSNKGVRLIAASDSRGRAWA